MCARAGEVLPHYAPLFVNAFLSGTASPLPALRCSAVSALATLCAKLRYALQPHLVDIVPPACHMLAMEAEVEVRRAAAYLLAELVAGAFRQPLPLRAGCRGCVQRLCVTIAWRQAWRTRSGRCCRSGLASSTVRCSGRTRGTRMT